MCPPDDPARTTFFSGPLEDEEVQRLLGIVDERLRLRQALELPAAMHGAIETLPLPPAPTPDATSFAEAVAIQDLSAPLFDPRKGARLARFAKSILNVPLRAATTPQVYFNAALRRILRAWSDLLRASADFDEILRIELAAQRRRIDRLAREQQRNAALIAQLRDLVRREAGPGHAPSGACVVELSCDVDGRVVLGVESEARPRFRADLGALPIAAETATELVLAGILEGFAREELEHRLLPHWRQLLRRGGLLRLRGVDWQRALERYGAGELSVESLHAITFGTSGERRTSYTRDGLVALVRRAGFTDCSVRAAGEDEDGRPAMELVARRPVD